MPVFSGNTSTDATSDTYSIPATIGTFIVTNADAAPVTVCIYIIQGSSILIAPKNLSLDIGVSYQGDGDILLPAGATIHITTTGSTDYYFSIA